MTEYEPLALNRAELECIGQIGVGNLFAVPDGDSTSARLRAVQDDYLHTQAALAASQAALTRMREERDRYAAEANKLHGEQIDLKAKLARVEAVRDITKAELQSARTELERLRTQTTEQESTTP